MAGSPWTNQAINLIVLTEQTTGFSGLFGYSPAVGAGNLIFSVAAAAGVDPYGNSYPQGVSSTVGQVIADAITTDTLTVSQGPFLLYGNTNQTTTTFTAGQSGNWTAPAGVTSVTAFGVAGGNRGGSGAAAPPGGGAGESFTQVFTVIPGNQYAYSVGNDGQDTTFNGITANHGTAATSTTPGAGGTGSNADTHFDGGPGGLGLFALFTDSPGGGGSSGGSLQAGNAGMTGAGGDAVLGGGAGGGPAAAGGVPGGGGGGDTSSPGAGGGGQLTLTYAAVAAADLLTSIAATAGSDTLGNSWNPGLTVDGNADVTGTMTVAVSLTVNGTDIGATLASVISALSGAATSTNGLADGTINGSSSTAGLADGTIGGTSGAQSAGTAHTHSHGSYAVNNGVHSHGNGSYAVADGTHDHTLPTV